MVTIQGNQARFRFYRPTAAGVHIAGDFNGWKTDQLPMRRQRDGTWEAVLLLPRGCYEFAYYVDGHWCIDYASFGLRVGSCRMSSSPRFGDPDTRDAG